MQFHFKIILLKESNINFGNLLTIYLIQQDSSSILLFITAFVFLFRPFPQFSCLISCSHLIAYSLDPPFSIISQ